jgi:hypothetical protein
MGQPANLSANRTAHERVIGLRKPVITEHHVTVYGVERTTMSEVIAFHT